MTHDNQPDQDDLDEIVSAVVDDEATSVERDRVTDDPQLTARVETFAELSRAVGTVPPQDDADREATLAAVLAAAASSETDREPTESGSAEGAVVPIAARRNHGGRSKRLVGAVAAVVIVLLAIPALLIGLNRDSGVSNVALSDSSTSNSGASSSLDAESGAPSTIASSPTTTSVVVGDPTAGLTTPSAMADLGSVSSPDQLSATVKQQLSAPSGVDSFDDSSALTTTSISALRESSTTTSEVVATPPMTGTPCESSVRQSVSGLGDLVLTATALYHGAPVQVFGFDDPTSEATIVVAVDPETCAIVEQLNA